MCWSLLVIACRFRFSSKQRQRRRRRQQSPDCEVYDATWWRLWSHKLLRLLFCVFARLHPYTHELTNQRAITAHSTQRSISHIRDVVAVVVRFFFFKLTNWYKIYINCCVRGLIWAWDLFISFWNWTFTDINFQSFFEFEIMNAMKFDGGGGGLLGDPNNHKGRLEFMEYTFHCLPCHGINFFLRSDGE